MKNLPLGLTRMVVDDESWHLVQNVRTLGKSISGGETRVQTPAVRFRLKLSLSCDFQDGKYWRAWLAQHQGGMLPDMFGPSDDHAALSEVGTSIGAYDDGEFFSDGTGFLDGGDALYTHTGSVIGSIDLTVASLSPLAVTIGQYISFGGRMHIVRGAVDNGDTTMTLEVWPPLRTAVPAGTPADRVPRCRMRLEDPEDGETPWGYGDTYIRFQVSLIEVPPAGELTDTYETVEGVYWS